MPFKKTNIFAYITGFSVASIVILVILYSLFEVKFKTNIDNAISHMILKIWGKDYFASSIENTLHTSLSNSLIAELNQKGANFDNTKKLTHHNLGLHSSFAVTNDPDLGYHLRPNASIAAHFIRTNRVQNLDPPLLYLNNTLKYSKELKQYLQNETITSYLLESDTNGFRKTYPQITSDKKILIIGDSVALGLGVDDQYTFASALQSLVVKRYQVFNAALSGYDTPQNFALFEKFKNQKFEHVVYIICAGDVTEYNHNLTKKINHFKTIIQRASSYYPLYKKVTIVLHSFLYDAMPHFFYPHKYHDIIKENKLINSQIIPFARKYNVTFINWFNIAQDYLAQKKTLFSPFALYADHCHFSAEGNMLLAKEVYKTAF